MENEIKEELRNRICEICGYEEYEEVTDIIYSNVPYKIIKLEKDINLHNETYRCILLVKCEYNPEDVNEVECAEDLFFDTFVL